MIIDELLISLGFKLDKKSVKDLKTFEEGFKKATANLLKMTAAAVAGATALVAFTKVMSESTDELAKSARRIGIEAQELDALRFAMNLVTGSGEGVNGMLESLSRNISEAARGTGSALEVFGLLDVRAVNASGSMREVSDVLLDVLASTEKLGNAQRLEFLEKLGLGGFALAANDVAAFTDALKTANELSFISKEDTDRAEKFNDDWAKLFRIVREFSVLISSSLSPFLSEVLEHFQAWAKANKAFLREDMAATFETLGKLFKVAAIFMGRMASTALGFAKAMGGLNTILKISIALFGLIAAVQLQKALLFGTQLVIGMAKAFTLLNIQALILPAVVISVIALIIALGDEIATFIRGGDTLFTRLFAKFPAFEDVVSDVIADVILTVEKLFAILEDPFNFDNWAKYFDFVEEGLINLGLIDAPDKIGKVDISTLPAVMPSGPNPFGNLGGAGAGGFSGGGIAGHGGIVQKVEVTVNGDATGVDKAALQTAIVKVVDENNRQALRNLETGLNK